jgi:Zn finger protein HypA/HybF involved in hydrogenase expression
MTELTGAARRAAAFRRMREAHGTEMAEDYVELISDLIRAHGEARLADLAVHVGVTSATAAKVVQRLQRAGLVESRPYRAIFLTEQARRSPKCPAGATRSWRTSCARSELTISRPKRTRKGSNIMSASRRSPRSNV